MKPDIFSNMTAKLGRAGNRIGGSLPHFITQSFRAKVLALVVLSVMVPSSLIWVFTVVNTERFQTERTRDRFNVVVNDAVREITVWYRERLTDTDRLLVSAAFRDPLRELVRATPSDAEYSAYQQEIEHYLTIVRERFPVYQAFIVVDAAGGVVWSSGAADYVDILDARTDISEDSGASVVSTVLFEPDTPAASQWIGAPVDVGHAKPAVVFARLDLSVLGAQLVSQDGVLDRYVVTSSGTLVTQPRFAEKESGTAHVGSRLRHIPAPATEAHIDRYHRDIKRTDGERSRVAFIGSRAQVPGQDLWIVCEAQRSRFIAPTLTRKNRVLLANTLVCILFVLAGWRLSQHLLGPMQELRHGAQKINEGMAGVQIRPTGSDEITDVIHAFNEMAQKISVSQAQLNAQNRILENKNTKLAETNDTLERLSITDGLTGLYNHRHFWELVDQAITADNDQNNLALVLMDIDDFKLVNDRLVTRSETS
jgi:HAMP domain-containing protein